MRYTPFLLALALSASYVLAEPTCTSLNLTVDITALNFELPLNTTAGNVLTAAALDALPRVQIQGTYNIAARYCEPEVVNQTRSNTLQILIHGLSYTKAYWTGLDYSDEYSYVTYASKQGYPTLAIDRICNGNSSHPNSATVCQLPANVETVYQIILQAHSGTIDGRKFDKVVPICHSEGSAVCTALMQAHPDVPVSTFVLMGFTNLFLVGAPAEATVAALLPAAIAKPAEFGNLDPGYVLITNGAGFQGIFYYGDYDHSLAAYDFANTHPITAGELATSEVSQLPAPDYAGSLLLLNGMEDQIFCTRIPTDPLVGYRGNCGSGSSSFTAETKVLFPKAKFQFAQVENTGHCIGLHRMAQQAFNITFAYLESEGL